MAFTKEELEEMRRADAEIERGFRLTPEDLRESRERDQAIKIDRLSRADQKIAAQQKAYREANRLQQGGCKQ